MSASLHHGRYLQGIDHTSEKHMKQLCTLAIVIVLATFHVPAEARSQHSAILQLKTVIPLPRVEGRIEQLDVDLRMEDED